MPSLPFKKQLELSWAAGFFDAEGHVRMSKRSTYRTKAGVHRTYNHNVAPVIQIAQNDRSVLVRFQKAVGRGKISGPFQYNPRWSPHWRLSMSNEADVAETMRMLMPYLSGPKKRQWKAVLAEIKKARSKWSVSDAA
jgi:hypothetical protein